MCEYESTACLHVVFCRTRRHRGGMHVWHVEPLAGVDPLLDKQPERPQGARKGDHVLDIESVLALGGFAAARLVSEAADDGAAEEDPGRQQASARSRLLRFRHAGGGGLY